MDTDRQIVQLEEALIRQAESLAREQLQHAEVLRTRILADASEKMKLAEDREVLAAKAQAERMVRRQTQAAETRLAAELDRLRWARTEATLAGVRSTFQERVNDDAQYFPAIEQWLAAAARDLPEGDLIAEVRGADEKRLAPQWAALSARAAPNRKVTLASHNAMSEGGIRVRMSDNRAQLDQSFEARQERLADELARVAMERLFASAPDLSVLAR